MENRATHILVECPELIVSAKLGVIDTLQELVRKGICDMQFVRTPEIRREHIIWADIVITVRGWERRTLDILRQAKKAGRFIIYYLDDDLLHVPKDALAWEYFSSPRLQEGLKEMIGLSDVLWGVNRNIKDKYLCFGNGRWMENKLPIRMSQRINGSKKKTDGVTKILYAGSIDHSILIRETLARPIRQICREFGSSVEVTFIGANPEIHDCKQVRYIPFIKPYDDYREYVESEGFQIGLAPARIDPFYACKYYNKYLEYASIGAVGIFTRTDPYLQIVEDRINGILCDNTEQAWYEAIKELIENKELREKCKRYSIAQIKSDFDAEQVADSLLIQCKELKTYRAKEVSEQEIKLKGWISLYIGRAQIFWESRGIASIPLIVGKAIKVCIKKVVKKVQNFVQRIF